MGYFPEDKRFFIESRYLGLTMPDELINRKKQLQSAGKEFRKTVSIEKIMQIAAIEDKEQRYYAMVGVIPSICYDTGKLVRFGYVELEEKKSNFLPKGTRIRGHEFHYFDSEENGSDCSAVKLVTGIDLSSAF